MRREQWLVINYVVSILIALIGNVVGSYLFPTFENQRWLAVAIFVVVAGVGLWLTVYKDSNTLDATSTDGLDRHLREKLLNLLVRLPDMATEGERRALLYRVFGEKISSQIEVKGSPKAFTSNLLSHLAAYGEVEPGKHAIWILLEEIRQDVGVDHQQRIDELQPAIEDLLVQPIRSVPTEYSITLRRIAPLMFVLLAVVVWYLGSLVKKGPLCPSGQVCVLVAQLAPQENSFAQQITEEIAQEIRDVLNVSESQNFEVKVAPSVTKGEEAKSLAQQEDALLVIWGRVFVEADKLRVYFELTDLLGIGESRLVHPFRVEPLFYDGIDEGIICTNCLDVVGKVAQRIGIVTNAAAGLAYYAHSEPEQAHFAFMSALYCAGEGEKLNKQLSNVRNQCKIAEGPSNWNSGLLYYYAGKAAALTGDYANAVDYLEWATRENPDDPAAWIGIGSTLQSWSAQLDTQEADEALQKAKKKIEKLKKGVVHPDDWAILYYDEGLIYERLGNWHNAQEKYEKAVERFGRDDIAAYVSLIRLGRVLHQAGDNNAAEQALKQARALDRNSPWAYLELAQLYQEDRQVAEQMLKQAETKAPNEVYVYITRAELCESRHWRDYGCAADSYTKALKKRSDFGWLHSRVGVFYTPTSPVLPHQSWELAKYHHQRAVELRPNDPWVHERLAYVLLSQESYDEAIQHYQRTIKLAYKKIAPAGVYCNLGIAQQRTGREAEAKENYERCTELATDDVQRANAEALLEHLEQGNME